MNMFSKGREDALASLGLVKTAARIPFFRNRPSIFKRFSNWAAKKAPTRTGVRDFMLGDPRRFGKEIVKGKALSKGSLLRGSFHAPDMLSKAMFYGFPAVEGVGIALDDEGNKTKRIGGALGASALGLAAYRPLGMVGSIGAAALGHSLGSGIGQTAAHIVSPQQQKLNVGSQEEPTYTYR